jgi:transposase
MQHLEKRRRRRHTPAFKAAAIAACDKPGASVSAVALELQVNANMLRRWIKQSASPAPERMRLRDTRVLPLSSAGFLPVPLGGRSEPTPAMPERSIRVHIRRGSTRITIEWPTSAAGACATWLRELTA